MDRDNFSQNNPNNNVHESNFTGFNNYPNNLPQTTNTDNYNDANAFCSYNGFSMMTDIPAHTPSNDFNISNQQFMSNNASASQSYPQCIGQNPPQSTFPPINSLNITINSPQTN